MKLHLFNKLSIKIWHREKVFNSTGTSSTPGLRIFSISYVNSIQNSLKEEVSDLDLISKYCLDVVSKLPKRVPQPPMRHRYVSDYTTHPEEAKKFSAYIKSITPHQDNEALKGYNAVQLDQIKKGIIQ